MFGLLPFGQHLRDRAPEHSMKQPRELLPACLISQDAPNWNGPQEKGQLAGDCAPMSHFDEHGT